MTEVKTQKCKTHPDTDAIHLSLATNEPLCVTCAVAIRREEAIYREQALTRDTPSVVSKLYNLEAQIPIGQHPVKICYQVVAGLIPGMALPEFTDEWWITGEQWEAIVNNPEMTPDHAENLFTRAQAEAYWYAERITDPRLINWVRVEFIYF